MESQKPKCGHLPIIILLIFVAIVGLTVGGVGIWQSKQAEVQERPADEDSTAKIVYPDGSVDEVPVENVSNCTDNEASTNYETKQVHITIKTKPQVVTIEEDDPYYCCSYVGYAKGIEGDELYAPSTGDRVIFTREGSADGVAFGGLVFDKNIEREFVLSGEVKRMLVSTFGNGGYEAIVALRTDGTLAAIRNSENGGDIMLKEIKGLSGITDIYSGTNGGGGDVFAIRADGSYVTLYSYIWPE